MSSNNIFKDTNRLQEFTTTSPNDIAAVINELRGRPANETQKTKKNTGGKPSRYI
jgi:hypothetical protein